MISLAKSRLRFGLFAAPLLLLLSVAVDAQTIPVDPLLRPYVETNELPGMATVIASPDGILQVDTIGYADVESKRPMTPETMFYMASQTKPVTAVAVMMLVEEGKLSLDEPVTTYAPVLKDLKVIAEQNDARTVLVPPERPITLRKLLSHTAGAVRTSPIQRECGAGSLPGPKALVSFSMTPLMHQPDTKYHYSTMGISFASCIVERVTGMPFDVFLDRRIFEPLGMKDTTFWPSPEQIERIAKVYERDATTGKLKEARISGMTYPLWDRTIRFSRGGGGLFSTPNDWVRFWRMMAGDGVFEGKRLISAESVKTIRTKQTGDLPQEYGLCVDIMGSRFGHGGNHGTFSRVDSATGRIAMYFIQEKGLAKAGEAHEAFFKIAFD